MSNLRILYVDDEDVVLSNVKEYFDGIYDIETINNPLEALELLKKNSYEIIISDYKMNNLSGIELLKEAKKLNKYRYSILITAYADRDVLGDAINNGLVNKFLEKPYKLKDLKLILEEAEKIINQIAEEEEKITTIKSSYEILKNEFKEEIIGINGSLKEIYNKILTVAKHDVNVFIFGETGTGKELVAKNIHYLSERRNGPFIKINSTAIPESLFESELFGYKKGAFSNALTDKPGKIELAHKGTLFLDEIGDMNLSLQAKLLRVLQEKEVERLGSNKVMKVDFRLIVAANKNIMEKIENKQFREDLYYRMNEFPISMPPLRERLQDIDDLVKYFIKQSCAELNIKELSITKEAIERLKKYNWPGNIRELKNAIKRVVIAYNDRGVINADDFDFLFIKNSGKEDSIDYAIEILKKSILEKKLELTQIEDLVVEKILKHFDGNVSEAVEKTGISKNRFYKIK